MEVPVSARSVRLDTLVVGLAAVDGDSAEPCVGHPGSASERMPLGPMAWCWSLRETENGARPDTAAPRPGSDKPPPQACAAGSRACRPGATPPSPTQCPSPAPPDSTLSLIPLLLYLADPERSRASPSAVWAPVSLSPGFSGVSQSFLNHGGPRRKRYNPRPAAWGGLGACCERGPAPKGQKSGRGRMFLLPQPLGLFRLSWLSLEQTGPLPDSCLSSPKHKSRAAGCSPAGGPPMEDRLALLSGSLSRVQDRGKRKW